MSSTTELGKLPLVKYLKNKKSKFIPIINSVFEDVKDALDNRIQAVFEKYTLHNTGHSFRIIGYMGELIEDHKKLSDLEITFLICAALLHDRGMAVSDEEIEKIKNDEFEFTDMKFSAMLVLMKGDKDLAIQEYTRRIHAKLSANYIKKELKEKLYIPGLSNLSFGDELAVICESHTENFDWIKDNLSSHDVKGDYPYNAQYLASILRLADILDIDGNRAPYKLYQLISPNVKGDQEWKQHFDISNNKKIENDPTTNHKKIVFYGTCNKAYIHRKILKYINWVGEELKNSVELVQGMPSQYNLDFEINPVVKITPIGYTFSDFEMKLEFKAISSLLMGEKIYGNHSLGLRELVQNSIDACRVRQEKAKEEEKVGDEEYRPIIKLILDPAKGKAIIKDNGIGMSLEVIKKHFLNIGVSYYKSDEFFLKGFKYKPIGNFGIGFLSCFMLSENVTVETRFYKSKDKYRIDLEKGDESSSIIKTEDIGFEGTKVTLEYSKFISAFDNNPKKVKDFLSKYFLTDGIDFKLINLEPNEMVVDISNKVEHSGELENGIIKIEFKNYLEDVDGYALVKKKSDFIRKFRDLNFVGDLHLYTSEVGLVEIDESYELKIDDYILNNEIKYIDIPIVEDRLEDDFLNGLEFTDGEIETVIEKYNNRLKWISVLVPKEFQPGLIDETIDKHQIIFDDFSFQTLVEYGHSKSCKTQTYVRSHNLYEGRKNELYLPFENGRLPFWYFRTDNKRKELFIRNVLIQDFKINIPFAATIFEIVTIVANFKSRELLPDISRNNLDKIGQESVNYLIGKTIHEAAGNLLKLDADEKSTIEKFVKMYYSKPFESKNEIDIY